MPLNVWYNALAAPSQTVPVIFEPPLALTAGRNEVWIAASGGEHWGGCEVWGSVNDESYDKIGIISHGGVIGKLTSPLPSAPDPDTGNRFRVVLLDGQLFSGAKSDADKFVTLCRIGNELLAYTAATLTAPLQYELGGYLRRGVFATKIEDHAAETSFARINQALFRQEYPTHLRGSTIYVKLPAFNEFQQMQQGLDEAPSYSITLSG